MRRLSVAGRALMAMAFLGGVACEGGNVNVSKECPAGESYEASSGQCVADEGADGGWEPDTPVDSGPDEPDGADGMTDPDGMADPEGWEEPWKDPDGDGVPNKLDNCWEEANSDQKDVDADGLGDVCDNCPGVANRDQKNTDGEPGGDACQDDASYDASRDTDGDGVPDRNDNCQMTANPDQKDPDGDGVGTSCDNCPEETNPTQTNSDGTGPGNACEPQPAGMICQRKQSDFQIVRPNIYVVIDRSTSMKRNDGTGKSRMRRAKEGLDLVAKQLHDKIRVGMSTYPCSRQGSGCSKVNKEFLKIGKYSENKIVDSYRKNFNDSTCPHGDARNLSGLDIETGGKHCTETGPALADVDNRSLYLDPQDKLSGKRTKRIVLITDGNACGCGGQSATVSAIRKLKNKGIKTHVVGFNFSNSKLNQAAMAGGTDAGAPGGQRFYSASNANQLVNALKNISSRTISCTYQLQASQNQIDGSKIWVKVDGSFVPDGEYTYDSQSKTLKLSNQTCQTLRNASTGGTAPLEIVQGCPDKCMPEGKETCDYKDNDCDGEVDEGCKGCQPEICDGDDNDCDGETDEGCRMCAAEGTACESDGVCCSGNCSEGTCAAPCRPSGVVCTGNGQCCSGTCAISGGQGSCVGG